MEAILKTVAKAYSARYRNLKDFLFLFPNKRCGLFLRKYLVEEGYLSEDMPHVLTVSEFMAQVARRTEAGHIIQLFTLFNAYREISGDEVSLEFDAFRTWGETVLSDFNTVDLNLADPDEIFKNIKDFRSIATDFLTDEQKEVMKEYFGVESYGESERFWKNFEDPDKITPLKQKFLNLWQILAPLHEKFVSALEEEGLGTTGTIYRKAAEVLAEKGRESLVYKKIVAVGFNALSESERSVFSDLKALEGYDGYDEFADFIWDCTGPYLSSGEFSASRFVDSNRKRFPMPEWFAPLLRQNEVKSYPQFRIISSPSLTSQTKIAGELLSEYVSGSERKMMTDAEVALVLPDESLLTNMLYSFPENIGDINLTMGISLRNTPVASFMALLRRVFVSSRKSSKGKVFFAKDLKMLFSHPYSYRLFEPIEVESLLEYIDRYHKIRLSLVEISEFIPQIDILLDYPENPLPFLQNMLQVLMERIEVNEPDSPDIQRIQIYKEYLEDLAITIEKYHIQSSAVALMQMVDRLISAEKIGFEGEKLSGLQVMGTLETRSLDFRHVIIMSMNEGIMPRRSMSSTFIPAALRKDYGLPPARYAEEIFAYYFFRLISRAEKVTLIYDGRSVSGLRGGQSRYLLQIRQFTPKEFISEESWQYRLHSKEVKSMSVEKTPFIMDKLEDFCRTGEVAKNFSASSLNNYRECQVKFFLQNVLNISADPERGEYMDAIAIGDVLHNVMMELYLPEKLHRKLLQYPVTMDLPGLKKILNNRQHIRDLVDKNIQIIYYGDKTGEGKKIESGVTDIIADQIVSLVEEIVKYDMTLAPFRLYGCEISEKLKVRLSSGREVNFRFAIDRLDEIMVNGEPRLRIVDYKTGGRKRKAKDLEEVFKGSYHGEQIFQLFIYAWLLGKMGVVGAEDVITEIYFVPDLITGKGGLPSLEGKEVESYSHYNEEFGERLENLIEDIFISPEFSDSKECEMCGFRSFCGR